MKTKTFFVLGSWVVLITLLYLSCSVRTNHYQHLRKHGKKTVGTVDHVGLGRYNISIVVAGRTFKRKSQDTPNDAFFRSEQYLVFYDEKDPSDFVVCLSNPVLDIETCHFDTTAPTEVGKAWLSQGTIGFRYVVNGEEYRRSQSVDNTDDWKNLQNVWIVYRADRPEIGYLVKKN